MIYERHSAVEPPVATWLDRKRSGLGLASEVEKLYIVPRDSSATGGSQKDLTSEQLLDKVTRDARSRRNDLDILDGANFLRGFLRRSRATG